MRTNYRGVSWSPQHRKWRATYKLDGKHIFLGLFDDPFEAGVAASDFRMEMSVPLKVVRRRGNAKRSKSVKAYRSSLPPEVLRAMSLKGHANRQGLLKSNKSGVEGISWNKNHERWFVQVREDGRTNSRPKRKRLGSYANLDEAVRMAEAYYATGEDPRLTDA